MRNFFLLLLNAIFEPILSESSDSDDSDDESLNLLMFKVTSVYKSVSPPPPLGASDPKTPTRGVRSLDPLWFQIMFGWVFNKKKKLGVKVKLLFILRPFFPYAIFPSTIFPWAIIKTGHAKIRAQGCNQEKLKK